METGAHGVGVKRLAALLLAALLLAALCLALGYAAGHASDKPPEAPPPEGVALWQTLPPEQLANVTEGILERISALEDDLARVQEMQQENMAYLHD